MPMERLSNIDTAWLRMEGASHPMMITMAMTFGAPLDLGRLKATFDERLLQFRRFRQRVIQPEQPHARYYWQNDPGFDLDVHLQTVSLRSPGDEAALRDLISELTSTQLDLSRPLWQFHLVEQYGEGWALVGRVHHCLADGPALLHVLVTMAETASGDQPAATGSAQVQGPEDRSLAIASLEATIRATEAMAREGAKIMRNPMRLFSLAHLGRGSTRALSKLLLRPPDPKTAFRGKLGTEKRVAWSVPIPLRDVRATGRLVDGTVNDVMLAAITGGLRRYLQSCGERVDGLCIRTGLSVNLRSPEEEIGLGNHAGAFLVSLPIGVAHPLDRLSEIKRAMDALKSSPEGTMVYGLLNALGMAPAEIQQELVASYCTRETAMTANVPGPAERLNLAGAPLDMLMFWVPAFGGVGLNLNIVSYAGQIRLGVASDRGLVPHPERIIDEFLVELDALRALADEPEAESADGAVSEDPFEALSAMLDDAARTLDEILEDT